MSKVILMVNVELQPGTQDAYLAATKSLRSHFEGIDGVSYTVMQNQSKTGASFSEMFTFSDMETYDAFDDREDEEADELFAKIIGMAVGSPKYTTLVEMV